MQVQNAEEELLFRSVGPVLRINIRRLPYLPMYRPWLATLYNRAYRVFTLVYVFVFAFVHEFVLRTFLV